MSALLGFNPQSRTFMSRSQDGRFEAKPATKQGIVNNIITGQPGPKVLSQNSAAASNAVKIFY